MLQTTGTLSGNNSVVECDLAKVEVAGSNPVSRSILNFARVGPLQFLHARCALGPPLRAVPSGPLAAAGILAFAPARRHSNCPCTDSAHALDTTEIPCQDEGWSRVAGRLLRATALRTAPSPSGKAEVCKTSIPGSNPGGASNPKFS